MNARFVTKSVVNNLNGFGISSTVTGVMNTYKKQSDYKILDVAINVATFVAAWNVSATIRSDIRARTDQKIDEFFDQLEANKAKTQNKK